jgi:ketosteroid isomerase-like protein
VRGEVSVSDEATKLEVLERVLDGFNRHDADAIVAEFSDDCVFESPRGPDPWGRRFVGRDEVREGFAARFRGIPDIHYEGRGDFVCGERGVSEWVVSGTTVDGEPVEVHGCDLWTFRGDQIICKNSFWKIVER